MFQLVIIILIANILQAKGDSFDAFQNTSLRPNNITSYNGSNFYSLIGFGSFPGRNTIYYALDWAAHRIIMFDKNWQYLNYKSFLNPANMIRINNTLYITSQNYIYKTDKYLNLIQQYNATGSAPSYRGIYYNWKNDTIYVVGYEVKTIYVFDLNLNMIDFFNLNKTKYYPWSIQEYNNEFYVGTFNGIILVIVNKEIIRTFNGCNGCYNSLVGSLIFDKNGYLAVTSSSLNAIYIYNSNGTYTGKSMKTAQYPYYTSFDSKGHLVIMSLFQISIYS